MPAATPSCGLCGGTRVCTPAGSGFPRPCPSCCPQSYPARVFRTEPFDDSPPARLRGSIGAVASRRFR